MEELIKRPHWLAIGLGWGYTLLVVMMLLNIYLFKTPFTEQFFIKNVVIWTVAGVLWGLLVRYLINRREKLVRQPS